MGADQNTLDALRRLAMDWAATPATVRRLNDAVGARQPLLKSA